MKGTKGAIWQGLSLVVVLALILGAFPLAPTASGAVGVTRGESQHLSGPGDGPAVTPGDGSSRETPLFMVLDAPITSNVNYPTNTSRWFFFNYDGSQTISVELQGDPAFSMNVFRGSNLYQEPGGSFVRFFTLQGALNSGEYFFQVQGGSSAAQSFTIVARAGAGGGALGDSRGSPDVMSGPLPVNRDIATSSVPGKWFSRNFLGIQDLDIIVGTPDPNVQLWVYYGSSPYPLPQSDGRKVFRVGLGSPVGDYFFEVRNVQAVSFNITLSGPMAAGACSQATPCPLNMDMPFKSNVGPNSSQWFQHNHADTSRRIGVELRSPSGSLSMNVRQGGTANPPVATNVRTYPLGEMANNWYFEVTGGFGGGDFEIVVPSQSAGTQMGPGGGPDRWSAAGLGMGDFRTGQLSSQQGTWFRFGFFGEPGRIALNTDAGGPINLNIYYGSSAAPLFSDTSPQPSKVYTLTTTSSYGDYFIEVFGAGAGPNQYSLRVERTGGAGAGGSSQSAALSLDVAPPAGIVRQTFTGNKIWFSYNYQVPFQPVDLHLDNGPGLVFDVFFGLSSAPIGTSHAGAEPSDQNFTISAPNAGTYYISVRAMGFMPEPISVPFDMMAHAGTGPAAGLPLGDRYNPQRLESDLEVKGYLQPLQNYWYSYAIPAGKQVEILLLMGDKGIALNVYGSDPSPIAPGVRSWFMPPFFAQPSVLVNVAAPYGGSYSLMARTSSSVAGDGSSKASAIPLPAELDLQGSLTGTTTKMWFVYQHIGMTTNFRLKRPFDQTPHPEVAMDIFTGDNSFPLPGSGSNSGFLGASMPPGPVFIAVYRTGGGTVVDFLLQATTQMQFGGPPPPGGAMFSQPSTSLIAHVMDCAELLGQPMEETLVPKARIAILYNGQVITTVTTITGTMSLVPSALPNGGRDGHYDLRGLPPKPSDITSDTQKGANCAPGFIIGADINGGLVFPPVDPQFGHPLRLEPVQLQGRVVAPDGTTPVAAARVKAVPDYGSTTGGFGTDGSSFMSLGYEGAGFAPPGGLDQSVVVKTNSSGLYKMGGFMPGMPYVIVAYPPDPEDGGPGNSAQSQPSNMRFSGDGFGFGGFIGGYDGYGGYTAPPPGGYTGYTAPPPGGYTGYAGLSAYTIASISKVRGTAEILAQTANLTLTTPNLIGTVTNPLGSSVAGAKVVAEEEFGSTFGPTMGPGSSTANYEAYSDANGTYRLGALTSGKTYKLIAKPPATGENSVYKASQPRRESYAGTQLTGVGLALSSTQISITVTSGGVAVPGARVELFSVGSMGPGIFNEDETDSNGQVTFGGLTDGLYNVMSFPPPDPKYFNLAPAAPQQAKIAGGTATPATLTFSLGAATLTGMVYKSDGTTPATGGISVEIFKNDFTYHYGVGVNQQGAFAAGGMPAGAYKVQARVHSGGFGFGGQSQDTDSIGKDVTIDASGKPDSSWDGKLVLSKPQVTVFVVDPNGSRPAFPVHVSQIGEMGEPMGEGKETDPATGQALIGGLADGTYRLGVFLPPMLPFAAPDPQSVTISNGTANPATITFQLVEPKKKVTGAIKKQDGTPVTNAGVHAFREDGSGNADTFVNASGLFELKLAKGGTWLLVVFPMFGGPGGPGKEAPMLAGRSIKDLAVQLDWIFGEEPRRVEFTLGDDATESLPDVNFTVTKANANVRGKVLLESNGQAPDAGTTFVDVRDEAGIGNGVPLFEDGTFNVAVPAGITARVRVFSKDPSLSQKGDPPLVEPKEGVPVDVGNIYLNRLSLTISGKVVIAGATDANGETVGVESVEVAAFKEGGLAFSRTTSSTGGVFTLPVSPGEWRLQARPGKGSRYVPRGRPVEVEITDQALSGVTLEVQAADGQIMANLTWAPGVTPPFAVSNLFGFGIALDQSGNSPAAGTQMERGSFRLRVPKGTKYTVTVDFPPGLSFGATPQTADLTTVATATVQIPVSVANATVIGEWKDKTGTRVQGLEGDVFASGTKGFKISALSATGRYNLSLIAGTWFIGGRMKSSGYVVQPPVENQVTAVAGDIVDGPTFTVLQANGKIAGTVKDPSGNGLVARVWADTKPATAGEATRLMADTVSTSTGAYEMNAPAGTYVVRAAVPPEKGYLPPLPVQAAVPETGNVTVNFQFKAPEVTISGNVSGPGASTALVTGYSDQGAWSSTTVSSTGAVSYTLNATSNDVWHLVASSSVSTTVYRSDPVDITVGANNVTGRSIRSALTDLVLKPVAALPLPSGSSVTFDATSMQVLALEDGTQVTIPGGALATSGNVTVYVIPTEKLTSQPNAQSRLIGYNLKAFDSNNVEIKKFKQSVTLKVPYPSDATLAAMGIEEAKLKPMYYDITSGSWVVSEPYTQDTVNNLFMITTDHFTVFAGILTSGAQQVGAGTNAVFVPYLAKNYSGGW